MLQRECRKGNGSRPQNNDRRMPHGEHKADRDRTFALLHQFAGYVIDRSNMVRIYGMPKAKTVGEKCCTQQDRVVAEYDERPEPGRQIE